MFDERDDAALVQKHLFFGRFLPLVLQTDRQTFVQEGQFAKSLSQHIKTEVQGFEDLSVRLEPDFGAPALRDAGVREGSTGLPALEALFKDLAVLPETV
jgi:hypothetical protein